MTVIRLVAWVVTGQVDQPGQPQLPALAYWGIAGFLFGFVLYLYMDERREHRRLRDKVMSDVLPALALNTAQLKETATALGARRDIDPREFSEWLRTLAEIRAVLDSRRRGPT